MLIEKEFIRMLRKCDFELVIVSFGSLTVFAYVFWFWYPLEQFIILNSVTGSDKCGSLFGWLPSGGPRLGAFGLARSSLGRLLLLPVLVRSVFALVWVLFGLALHAPSRPC